MSENHVETFFTRLAENCNSQQFIKLTLSNKLDKNSELRNVFVKPVLLKGGSRLSFVYRYPTKDITKNYDQADALTLLRAMMGKDFSKADLYTMVKDFHLTIHKNGKSTLLQKLPLSQEAPVMVHNKEKSCSVAPEGNIYLHQLGITTVDGKVKNDKQDKYRQINKYVEIVDSIMKEAGLPDSFTIADMGAGKGYLTFALYDYLSNTLHIHPHLTGVELRNELVNNCNNIAKEAGFINLEFRAGSIETTDVPKADMLIALHACDTATDQAIYRGITDGAKVIICAPCCHKQVRKHMHPANDLKAISAYGILEERQAEILTDTIRALVLKAFGYKTKVFEFISTEHTPKNVMIRGIKTGIEPSIRVEALAQIKNLKALFNLEYHHLEKLMGI